MNRPTLTLLALLGLAGVGAPASPAAAVAEQTADLPAPDLSTLEPAVADQLAEVRELTLATVADPSATAADKAGAWWEMARLYHAYDLLEAAEACYRRAGELDGGTGDWVYYLGHVALTRGDLEAAVGHFTQALGALPDDLALLVHLADALIGLDRLPTAREVLRRAEELAPRAPVVWARLGELALAEGEYQEAVDRLTAVLEAVPQASRLQHALGMAYRGLGDLDAAREHLALRGEVGLAPNDPRMEELAGLQVGERVHLLRGRKAFQAGSYAEAAEEFRFAVEAKPDSVRARVNLSAALSGMGDSDGATEELLQAVAMEPANATARFNLATLLAASGRHELAIAHFSATVGQQPEDEEAWIGEAKSWIALGDFAQAVERLDTAVAILPRSGKLAFALGRLLAAAPDRSVRDGQRAFDLASRVFEVMRTAEYAALMALAQRELGQCAEAAQFLDELIAKAEQLDNEAVAAYLRPERAAIADSSSCRP
jgi:tetratricopeptide (TPR) repeat protein